MLLKKRVVAVVAVVKAADSSSVSFIRQTLARKETVEEKKREREKGKREKERARKKTAYLAPPRSDALSSCSGSDELASSTNTFSAATLWSKTGKTHRCPGRLADRDTLPSASMAALFHDWFQRAEWVVLV